MADYAKHLWDQLRLHSGAEVRPGIAGEPPGVARGGGTASSWDAIRQRSWSTQNAIPVSGTYSPALSSVTGCGSAVVVADQLISAGAVCPVVIRAAGHRAQVVVCGQDELSRLVGGQLWMVLHQVCGYLSTREVPNPQSPVHLVAVFQH